jgi:osmotically inducible protein OsmC
MPSAQSKATAVWHGDLMKGSGEVSLASGVIKNAPVSWAARTEREGANAGKTSPEELIAGALASCFEMGLSNALGGNGTPPEELSTTATATFEVGGGGVKVASIHLDLEGKVPGMSATDFERFAQEAKNNCPVSGALKGNVEITLNAKLAG